MYGKGVCNGLYTMSYDVDGGFFRILVQELRKVLQRAETKDIETDRVSEDMICHIVDPVWVRPIYVAYCNIAGQEKLI